ncbi:MAG: hypothetical protein J4215_04900 [Candidatus Diapherotrites archaeon]|uniref:Glycosidase n=1 Tax=Candidatus Iainarchaeum sp. TaxID=3101447 RepID=A0A8T4L4Z0_9ARCH|nr:hypothetical protein [Candidatus Diapherotrites archaeon]
MLKTDPRIIVRPTSLISSSPKLRIRGVLNPSADRLKDGHILLYARVAETPYHGERYFLSPRMMGSKSYSFRMEKIPRTKGQVSSEAFVTKEGLIRLPTISHFRRIYLDENAEKVIHLNQKPDFFGIKGECDFGVEDPRTTFFEELNLHAMTYVSVSDHAGVSTSMATSKDLKRWTRFGITFSQQNKDVVLFPRKVNGRFVALHRPEGTMNFNRPSIWISYSKDLQYWGFDKPLMQPRFEAWDSLRIGAGTPPVEIEDGFLDLYHGVSYMDPNDDSKGKRYCAGAVVFDKENPEVILARTPKTEPLFAPELPEEKVGFVDNVVFPTDTVWKDKTKKELFVFAGAGDSAISVRSVRLKAVLNSLTWFK